MHSILRCSTELRGKCRRPLPGLWEVHVWVLAPTAGWRSWGTCLEMETTSAIVFTISPFLRTPVYSLYRSQCHSFSRASFQRTFLLRERCSLQDPSNSILQRIEKGAYSLDAIVYASRKSQTCFSNPLRPSHKIAPFSHSMVRHYSFNNVAHLNLRQHFFKCRSS